MILTTKYSLGQEVWYGDKYQRRKGEIISIRFDGSFNNMPIYEIGYVGNVWCEDEVSECE